MKITTARELQNNFKAGLQIVGENSEGELEWMGNDKEWQETLNAYWDEHNQLSETNGK